MNDLISRQTVLRCIKESRDNIDWGQSEDGDAFLHYTGALYRTIASEECLPSAERKGEWIHPYHYGLALPEHKCSECGYWEYEDTESDECPNCGAKMEGEEE